MDKRWCTKEDILKDLEVVSGHPVADVEDGYFLYGEQPPPPRAVDDEDKEIELRFGRAASQGLSQAEPPEPDLIGITRMLRMVQQQHDNNTFTGDEDLVVTSHKKVVITKANSIKSPNDKETLDLNLKQGNNKKSHLSRNPNNYTNTEKLLNTSNDGLSSNERGSSDENSLNSTFNSSKGARSADTNQGTRDSTPFIRMKNCKEASPVKITTNNNIFASKLNPNTKEFIPKSAQITPSRSDKTTKNYGICDVNSAVNIDYAINNKKLENEINQSEITNDVTAVKNEDDPKEMKKQMAMMLRNKISIKNETIQAQHQTNRAIVNLMKLYTDSKPAKPMKLLTPQFFENCKATELNDDTNEWNKTDRSIERMTLLRDVNKVNVGEIPFISQTSIPESKVAMSVAYAPAENSDTGADISLHKEKDRERNNDDIAPASNDLVESDNLVDNEDFNNAVFNKNNDPYMKESINKVNNWLHDKPVVTIPENKSPKLYLGVIGFKRKDLVTCKSPSEVCVKKVSKPTEYKPSSYAEELHKKFSDRNKAITPTPTLNIWEKLEADLKKKDLEIKSKKNTREKEAKE